MSASDSGFQATSRPANRLARETSPYLLQHAHNPVDWFPWGEEAFAKAKAENKPIFLSVGYSACHWCHVMERESFESPTIAALMNQWFVNIKVDREERPDIDQIYMAAVQALNQGHGGWPMSVFMTPEGEPFFGGTYYPPHDARGMPGFPRILEGLATAWREREPEVREAAARLVEHLRKRNEPMPPLIKGPALDHPAADDRDGLDPGWIAEAARALGRVFDSRYGGFGSAPKFPHPMDLKLLLRHHQRVQDPRALAMVIQTLDHMSRGGIYDHLGGGFARYATDERWLVPHFEKMLYDNALLISALAETIQCRPDPTLARVVVETLDYLAERMTGPPEAPGFFATEDADSEGVEGKYYVWSRDEVLETLGEPLGSLFAEVYDVTEAGNWEGHSILNLPEPLDRVAQRLGRPTDQLAAELAQARALLKARRDRRIPPGKDTKILTSWNGLMLAAIAEAAWVVDRPDHLERAEKAAGFLLDHLRQPDGRLFHVFKDGRARFNGYLEDYAYLIDGLTRLGQVTGTTRWIREARDLSRLMIEEFGDEVIDGVGGFAFTGVRHETLVARPRDLFDNATPSAAAMAVTALLRLAALTDDQALRGRGLAGLRALAPLMKHAPTAAAQSLIALDFALRDPEIALVVPGQLDPSDTLAQVLRLLHRDFQPGRLLLVRSLDPPHPHDLHLLPPLQGRDHPHDHVTLYLCRGQICQAPLVGVEAIAQALTSPPT